MPSLEQTFRLQVPSSPENLALIREFVTRVGAQAGLVEEDVTRLELAVDEACANVIEHAHGNDASREISVRATFDAETLRIGIVDTGAGFDLGKVEAADLPRLVSERRRGGLGLEIIRTVMDDVRYEHEPGRRNELQMTKRLRKA